MKYPAAAKKPRAIIVSKPLMLRLQKMIKSID